jgi:Xaa-Pro aminopeptidase
MFAEKTYIERRRRLKEQLTSGLILLLGNEESPINYADNTYHFRQDSTFLYFFGLDFAGLAGLIDLDEGKDYIFGNDLTIDDIVWMGNQPTLQEKAMKAGIENTGPLAALDELIQKAKNQNRPMHFLPPYRPENKIKLFNLLDVNPLKAQEAASVDLLQAVVNLRNIKFDEEIAEIEKAVNISVDMHLAAMRTVKPGITEAQVAAAVQEVAVAAGGQTAFPIIATIHGEILHNHYHGNMLRNGDMFLLDAGAETEMHYAGDLSSTIPVDDKFTERQ